VPIALLLTSLATPLAGLAAAFERWNAVLRLEAVVVDRARSAFLVDWFGNRLPRTNGRLRIVISNIDALGERYREARSRSMGGQTGPNLLEPVAGMAGMMAGLLISPSGAVMYLYASVRQSLCSIGSILLTLLYHPHFIAIFTGLGGAVALVLLPIALVGGIVIAAIGASANSTLTLAHEALGDAARAILALTRFINLLTGPREHIRNPLLRGILQLFDRVAALLAQLIGAAALLLTRLGRLILPLAIQFRAMQRLGEFTLGLAAELLTDAYRIFTGLWRSEEGRGRTPWALLLGMMDHVMAVAGLMAAGAGEVLAELGRRLTEGFTGIANRATGYVRLIADEATAAIGAIPLIHTFRRAALMATAVRSIIGAGSGPRASPPPAAGGGPSAVASALAPAALLTRLIPEPPPPSLEAAQAMVEAARRHTGPGTAPGARGLTTAMAAPFELDAASRGLVADLIASPPSVFSGERRAIAEELDGASTEDGLAALRANELRYRDLLYSIVGRALPGMARVRIPDLLDTFNAIDRYLYEREDTPTAESEFPVLHLPDNGLLRPVVTRLVVRSAGGGDGVSLRNIANDVARLMRAQPYHAPAV
jgi:hypothetical protein